MTQNKTPKQTEGKKIEEFALDIRIMIGEDLPLGNNLDERAYSNTMMINGQKDIYRTKLIELLKKHGIDGRKIYQSYISSLKKETKNET